MKRHARLAAALVGLALTASMRGEAQDIERGRMLHENHCRMCHDSVAYKRGGHIAKNYEEVRAQATRWQMNTGLHWTPEDINNVTAYIVQRYYRFPSPSQAK
jgi:mono/diheme cytochrome c family protein